MQLKVIWSFLSILWSFNINRWSLRAIFIGLGNCHWSNEEQCLILKSCVAKVVSLFCTLLKVCLSQSFSGRCVQTCECVLLSSRTQCFQPQENTSKQSDCGAVRYSPFKIPVFINSHYSSLSFNFNFHN